MPRTIDELPTQAFLCVLIVLTWVALAICWVDDQVWSIRHRWKF